jgi:hypothetical protein
MGYRILLPFPAVYMPAATAFEHQVCAISLSKGFIGQRRLSSENEKKQKLSLSLGACSGSARPGA